MNSVRILPGRRYRIVAPHSEVAGRPMLVELTGTRAAQLYRLDGSPFSAPITRGEAGIFSDEGMYAYAEETA